MAYKNRWNSYSDNFGHHEPCAYGNTRRTGERTNISKGGSISVPSYGNSRQNRGTNNAKNLGSIGLLFCVTADRMAKNFGQRRART